jgi:chloramphenicol-sensitive protein RarD
MGQPARELQTASTTRAPVRHDRSDAYAAIGWALAAYVWWGLNPLYFKALGHVAPPEVLAHRIVWSAVVLAIAISVLKRWPVVSRIVRDRRVLGLLLLSTLLLTANWFVFIVAVAHEHVLDASIGYFINPLVSVLLGSIVLGERLTRAEWTAVALAAVAVAGLTLALGSVPWVALFLASTFAMYGLVRKIAQASSLEALAVETTLLVPAAAIYLLARARGGELAFGAISSSTDALILSAGVVTVVPLLCFGLAVGRLRLSTIGLLQYIAPTLQLLLAVVVYHEPFLLAEKVALVSIWAALAIFSNDNLRRAR